MQKDWARENSVKQLAELYNVVSGVALALAITRLINVDAPTIPVHGDRVVNFITLMVVIVPFHQGAARHLFATYVENGGSTRIKRGALALDFLILFAEACLFVALALLIGNIALFTVALIALLATDCVWGFLAALAFTGAHAQAAERKWAFINVVALGVLILMYIFGPRVLGGWSSEMELAVLVVSALRTIVDYYACWDFYYPG